MERYIYGFLDFQALKYTATIGSIDGQFVALKQINLAGAKGEREKMQILSLTTIFSDKNDVRRAVKYEVDMMKAAKHRSLKPLPISRHLLIQFSGMSLDTLGRFSQRERKS